MSDQSNLPATLNSKELATYSNSVFTDQLLTDEVFEAGVKFIKSAYPNMKQPDSFFITLKRRCKDNGFTNLRFRKAVANMVDTQEFCSIAHIIKFDQKINLIPIKKFNEEVASKENSKYYTLIEHDGKPFYVLNEDVEKHKLPIWEQKESQKQLEAPQQTDADREFLRKLFADTKKQIDDKLGA